MDGGRMKYTLEQIKEFLKSFLPEAMPGTKVQEEQVAFLYIAPGIVADLVDEVERLKKEAANYKEHYTASVLRGDGYLDDERKTFARLEKAIEALRDIKVNGYGPAVVIANEALKKLGVDNV